MIRLVIVAIALMSVPAAAEDMPCGPLTQIVAAITGPQYREVALFDGSTIKSKLPVHVYANVSTGTWSFVLVPKPDYACIVLSGEGFKPAGTINGQPI